MEFLIALNGRIVLGEESTALREKLKSLIAGEKKNRPGTWRNRLFFYIDKARDSALLVAAPPHAKNVGASYLGNLVKNSRSPVQLTQAADRFRCLQTRSRRRRHCFRLPGRQQLAVVLT